MLPEMREKRTRHAAMLSQALSQITGVRPLPPQPELTRETLYNYVFQYRPQGPAPSRDLFVAALEAEGIPCEGRFYDAVYRSDLFCATPENCPQLRLEREVPMDYAACRCPVSERAAYEEAVWLPQFVLIGDDTDVQDVVEAIQKVASQLESLAAADPALARAKGMSRSQRARFERKKNY
jgi:dTDP-4-amino-4,6-dideoxygalactose transaminase